MGQEANKYLNTLFDINNPLIYCIIIIFFLLIFIYIFYKYIFFPAQKKLIVEKKELEMKSIKLMALFAELDPDPVIRIDKDGTILQINEAAKIIGEHKELVGEKIRRYFSDLPENLGELIKKDSSFTIPFQKNKKFFEVCFKSVPGLQITQLYFRDLTERKLFEKELIESKKSLRNLTSHIQDTVEEERKRIARELHDSIGQNLLFIKLLLRECNSLQQFEQIRDSLLPVLDSAVTELKRISYQLKPLILDETDLATAIGVLSNKFMRESNIAGEFNYLGKRERFDNRIEIAIYRVIQEALTNILKHSEAKHFDIQIINNKEFIKVLVSDDGVGINPCPATKHNFGILNMNERIEGLNGSLKIETSEGNGTIIMITIPKNVYDNGR